MISIKHGPQFASAEFTQFLEGALYKHILTIQPYWTFCTNTETNSEGYT